MLSIAARNWMEEIRTIREGLKTLDERQVKSVRYEDFLTDPLSSLRNMLDFLGVISCPEYETTVRALNLGPRLEAWHSWNASELDTVMKIQREGLSSLGYI